METQLHIGKKVLEEGFEVRSIGEGKWIKPTGGFWTSTYLPEGPHASKWIEFCDQEDFWGEGKVGTLLDVKDDARVYSIDSKPHLDALLMIGKKRIVHTDRYYPSWGLMRVLYDGIRLTERGEWETRYSYPNSLYGWDSESTLWFRNVFHNVRPYKGELIRREAVGSIC